MRVMMRNCLPTLCHTSRHRDSNDGIPCDGERVLFLWMFLLGLDVLHLAMVVWTYFDVAFGIPRDGIFMWIGIFIVRGEVFGFHQCFAMNDNCGDLCVCARICVCVGNCGMRPV